MSKDKSKRLIQTTDGDYITVREYLFGGIDYGLLLAMLLLIIFGLVMVYSTSYYTALMNPKINDGFYFLKKQLFAFALGLIPFIICMFLNLEKLMGLFAWASYGASIVFMVLVNYTSFGIEVNGRKRWFGIGGSSLFQPTELVKLSAILLTAFLITKYKKKIDKVAVFLFIMVLVAIPAGLVLANNLSSGIIIFGTAFIMIFCASRKHKKYILCICLLLLIVFIAVFLGDWLADIGLIKQYQLDRIHIWLNPTEYYDEGGYQVVQGLYAIGSGGLFGKGIGGSTQKLGFVPEAQNDMIFSIICEELGIFGALCLIALFVFMFYRLFKIAQRARKSNYCFFYVLGVMTHLSLQVIFNVAVVTGIMPNTGITLPFISYGGTSVLFLMAEMGLVFSVARRFPEKKSSKDRNEVIEEEV